MSSRKRSSKRGKQKQIKKSSLRAFRTTLCLLVLCVAAAGALFVIKYSPLKPFVMLRDRKPPVAIVRDMVSVNGQTYTIDDFVDQVEDSTNVRMSFLAAPNFDVDGRQEVVIRFTDEAGNYTDKTAILDVIHDTEPPVILGGDDVVYSYVGESIAYRDLVQVTDDKDESPNLEIDNEQVDITQPGIYTVYFTATDRTGNSSFKAVNIQILEPDSEEYYLMKANELCDKIISQIITDDMDTLHQIWAVYEYVRNIPYILTDYTRDYIREGYKILSEYGGDCFGSYSAVRLLLDRLGIDNLPIQTNENWTVHFWNMASIDGGQTWYHVDATNWTEWSYRPEMCMISDTRLDYISEQHGGTHMRITSDYPATPYNSLDIPLDIQEKYGITDWNWW